MTRPAVNPDGIPVGTLLAWFAEARRMRELEVKWDGNKNGSKAVLVEPKPTKAPKR